MKLMRTKRAPARPLGTAPRESVEALNRLIYELLDAHHDTVELLSPGTEPLPPSLEAGPQGPSEGLLVCAHLDYLQALQRKAREVLAGVWLGYDR